ncbi:MULTISPECIES: group II truncated hemoglobin [Deefgea]|uniref:Hemoglobin-like protein n=1 Tax=Deefgea chitinilytica TaxID=570276 RepID=A0ABS2CAC1_9NEIS|nr:MULTISPECIES: group II truncated hemoglobin [Deefgea]MBM5571002.1 hemoglobin-like protein [Deefgea chitinilytica]MBM9888232.1 group II truncated hemoglobin [Deefgea sp. CFH1-16]
MSDVVEVTPYELLGGASVLRQLVDRFYDIMASDSRAAGIHAMHGQDTTLIREKLFEFLSGWLGGPQLFIEKYGHPRLRSRHMPFAIGESERDQWMLCMLQAMAEIPMSDDLRSHLEEAFMKTADFMRNH